MQRIVTLIITDISGRIINVSSHWHKFAMIDFDKYYRNNEEEFRQDHTIRSRYSESKLAQIMHATYLQTNFFSKYNLPLIAVSVHPGGVNSNIFWPKAAKILRAIIYPWMLIAFRNCKQGAQSQIFCAMGDIGKESNGFEIVPGAYHFNCKPKITEDKNGQSTDPKQMKKLWDYCYKTLAMVGIKEMIFDQVNNKFVQG